MRVSFQLTRSSHLQLLNMTSDVLMDGWRVLMYCKAAPAAILFRHLWTNVFTTDQLVKAVKSLTHQLRPR